MGCEGQSKPPGQRESFLLALPLQDSSNVRAATSNTTHVSQRKCLLCHGQHIKIKTFLKLSAAQRLCMSAFQILKPFEKLPHGPAFLSDATAWSLWLESPRWLQLKEQRGERRRIPASSWVPGGWGGAWWLAQEAWHWGEGVGRQLGQLWTSQAQAGSYSDSSSTCLFTCIYWHRTPVSPTSAVVTGKRCRPSPMVTMFSFIMAVALLLLTTF